MAEATLPWGSRSGGQVVRPRGRPSDPQELLEQVEMQIDDLCWPKKRIQRGPLPAPWSGGPLLFTCDAYRERLLFGQTWNSLVGGGVISFRQSSLFCWSSQECMQAFS